MKYTDMLQDINWFKQVGETIEESKFEFPIQNAKDLSECIKNISSLKWENFVLYARNRLSWYIQSFHKDEHKKWNETAKAARENFEAIKPAIQENAALKNIPEPVIVDIRSIMISAFIEQVYTEMLGASIPQQFGKLITVYQAGKIPCGWIGKLPENEGHQSVNFDAGKILIW